MKSIKLLAAAAVSFSCLAASAADMRFIFDERTNSMIATGTIVDNSHEALSAALKKYPSTKTLILESTSMTERGAWAVLHMRGVVKEKKLRTVSLGKCSSGCVSVFNAGADRLLGNMEMATPNESELVDYVVAFKRHVK